MSNSYSPLFRASSANTIQQVLYAASFLALTYAAAMSVAGLDMADRSKVIGTWMLLAAAFLVSAPPNLLFPCRKLSLIQLLNPPPRILGSVLFRPWLILIFGWMLPGLVLCFYDPLMPGAFIFQKTALLLACLCILAGTGLTSFIVFMRLGRISQQWSEGKRGIFFQKLKKEVPGIIFLPNGLIPSFLATPGLYLLTLTALIPTLYLNAAGMYGLMLLPGSLYFLGSLFMFFKTQVQFDQSFYPSNALFSELFSTGGPRNEDRQPVTLESLYWIPWKWRSHAWSILVQFDRRLPLGRFVFLGHLVFWLMLLRDSTTALVHACLLILILGTNLAIMIPSRPEFSPPQFQLSMLPPSGWVITRFFVNMRWLLPLGLSLLISAWLDDQFTFVQAGGWFLIGGGASFVTALLSTINHEIRYKKRYA